MLRQNDPVLHHVDRSFLEYVEKMDDGRMTDEDMELMERGY
jgi:disease resistance protein RPS2